MKDLSPIISSIRATSWVKIFIFNFISPPLRLDRGGGREGFQLQETQQVTSLNPSTGFLGEFFFSAFFKRLTKHCRRLLGQLMLPQREVKSQKASKARIRTQNLLIKHLIPKKRSVWTCQLPERPSVSWRLAKLILNRKKVPKNLATRVPPFNRQMYQERCQHCKTCKDCNDWADGVEKKHKRSYIRQYRIIKRAEEAFAVMVKFVRECQKIRAALSKWTQRTLASLLLIIFIIFINKQSHAHTQAHTHHTGTQTQTRTHTHFWLLKNLFAKIRSWQYKEFFSSFSKMHFFTH